VPHLFSEPSFRLSRGPKRSPSLNFAGVRRAGVVEGLSCYLPMRFVSIGRPHVHHERMSVVGVFNPISAGLWFQSHRDKSHFPKLSGRRRNYRPPATQSDPGAIVPGNPILATCRHSGFVFQGGRCRSLRGRKRTGGDPGVVAGRVPPLVPRWIGAAIYLFARATLDGLH
jgi:hypothetical protein